MRFLRSLIFAAAVLAGASLLGAPKTGIFPGRLPGDIVSVPPAQSGLSPPWQRAEIGGATAGTASDQGGVLTQSCFGDLGGTTDTGATVYQSLTGDYEMVAQLLTLTGDDPFKRHGLRIGDDATTGNGKYAMVSRDGNSGASFAWRDTVGANGQYMGATTLAVNTWIRLTKNGSNFSGYYGSSSTGPWTLMGSATITMSGADAYGTYCDNGGVATSATITMTLPTITPVVGSAGTVQFTTSTQSVNEDGGTLVVSVSRVNGTTGSGSIVVSRDGTSTATSGIDYTASPTLPATLSWTGGDSANKTVTLTLINRAGSQASRHLDLSLGSASTVTLGTPSADIVTINDVSSGATTKFNPGWYGDCYEDTPYGGDQRLAYGNVEWVRVTQCIDFWSTQIAYGIKGVQVGSTWASWEGSTLGCYDATCSNDLGAAGTIGDPLLDALLNYAQSKGLRVILAIDWFNAGYGSCGEGYNTGGSLNLGGPAVWIPRYLLQNTCSPGTDASTYGVTLMTQAQSGYMVDKLWKSAEMDRYIAMVAHVGARGDNHKALEAVIAMHQEGDCGTCAAADGTFNDATLSTQIARIPAAVKPSMPHTNLLVAMAWTGNPSDTLTNANSTANASGTWNNDWIPTDTDTLQAAYVGVVYAGNSSTHDFRAELPNGIARAGVEVCATRYGFTWVMSDLYNASMINGHTHSTGKPQKPSWGVVGRQGWQCPSDATQQWGTPSSGGINQQINALSPLNTVCPSRYAGCATNTLP